MASGDISVVINSETKAFKQGVENGIIKPLEDAEKALDELGRSKGPEQLDREMRDAQRSTEELQDELKDAARDLDKLGFAARDAGTDGKAGLDKIKGGAQEVQQEIGQNLGEAVSSFSGDLSDLGQVGQDTLGGLAATIAGTGPAGLVGAALLAAAAIGVGGISASLAEAEEKRQALAERASELAQAYVDAKGDVVPVIDAIADKLAEMATETDDAETSLKDLADAADDADFDFKTLAKAYAGNTDGLKDLLKQEEKELAILEESSEKHSKRKSSVADDAEAQRTLVGYLQDASSAAEQAAEMEKLYAESGGPEMELKAELLESVADAYDGVRDSAIDAATNEEGVFDVAKWAEYVAQHRTQVEQYQTNLQGLKLDSGQWANLMEMPEDARMAVVASLVSGPEEAKPAIIAALTDAGSEGMSGLQISLDDYNLTTEAEVTADATKADGTIKETTKDREVKVKVKLDTSEYDSWKPANKTGKVLATVDKRAWDDWDPKTKIGVVQVKWE